MIGSPNFQTYYQMQFKTYTKQLIYGYIKMFVIRKEIEHSWGPKIEGFGIDTDFWDTFSSISPFQLSL